MGTRLNEEQQESQPLGCPAARKAASRMPKGEIRKLGRGQVGFDLECYMRNLGFILRINH